MSFSSRVVCAAFALSSLVWGNSLRADIVFEDDFNNNGALLGSTPGVGGVWTITGTSTVNPLTVTGNALQMANNGQDAFGAFTSPVPVTGGNSIYTGATVVVTAANTAGDYFMHLSNPASTTTTIFLQRLFVRSSGAGFQFGLASNSGTGAVTTWGTTELSLNQAYRVVTSWDFVAGSGNDVFNVYVDPTDATQGNNTAYIAGYNWTGTAEPTALAAFNVRQGTAANAATLSVDNVTVATTFSEAARLTAIPEPTAAGLALMGLIGLAGFNRRRNG